MCGIFGYTIDNDTEYSSGEFYKINKLLFKLSESRGKEAAGLALSYKDKINVYKEPVEASKFIRSPIYKNLYQKIIDVEQVREPFCLIGHARLVTNGSEESAINNQPTVKDGMVCIHNGIVTNSDMLWSRYPELSREYQTDTEVIPALLKMFINSGESIASAASKTFRLLEGTASVALLLSEYNVLLLATNNGSLYYNSGDSFFFASEKMILDDLFSKLRLEKVDIIQLKPNTGRIINLADLNHYFFSFSDDRHNIPDFQKSSKEISVLSSLYKPQLHNLSLNEKDIVINSDLLSQLNYAFACYEDRINELRRCSKCILPETMPFIEYDEDGVCNYCRYYKKLPEQFGRDTLKDDVNKYRNENGNPDCIVSFSGGRDSSYGLHVIKKELGLNPVAYTYDWGMLTNLGRRNQARLCGKLGVEHILISADIRKKRENIRKNVLAWLNKPTLGTIPLFMAGDKQYFYHLNKLQKELNIDLVIYCMNELETTNFKYGFAGIKPIFNKYRSFNLKTKDKIKLGLYYGKQYLINPGYINTSLFDTLSAYGSYYFTSRDYLFLFKYLKWDERTVVDTLLDEYNWEMAQDTKTSWRIGDGTTSFYNYIYYTVAGFTENDTFCSNQIREGGISRENAIKVAKIRNQPRYESIKWYCDTIGIDFEGAIKAINGAPKLYPIK